MKIDAPVNDRGHRIGQHHPQAKLSDREVEHLLVLKAEGWGWRRLSRKFEISKTACRKICAGTTRGQAVAGHRAIAIADAPGGAG